MKSERKFPEVMRTARVEAKMSLRELGARIYRSGEYVAALERGGFIPKRKVAIAIARAISSYDKHTRIAAAKLELNLVDASRQDAIAHALDRWERA